MRPRPSGARLVGLTVLAALLFSPPLLPLFDIPTDGGLSWLPLYVFAAWLVVIALAAWLLERKSADED